ncbi:zinc-binding dehydrogenase [Arthrobacter sulfonylureivorans]|uniref:zinc-binding dehydrogenase n=1 Tax=Arthrobacter TaxID=1663 RepID=UPI0010AC9DEA|nr:zinc-binding dehydrogenase [Arthrobacter sp. CAU 1506]TJY66127.1 zinc-binding alcohol dehydrogenase [Arthrobacter sp. CAU 1506]
MLEIKSAILEKFGVPFEIHDVSLKDPVAGEVIVRTTAAPFCSTDWLGWKAMRNKQPPVILGHTAVGIVEHTGTGVTGVETGDRVVVAGTPQCGECFYCEIDRPDQCAALLEMPEPLVAVKQDGTEVRAAGRVGAYAEYILANQNQIWKLESDLPASQLSLLGCGITTGHGAVFNVAQVQPGQSVAVVGLGHLGQWMIQSARVAGAGTIIGLDLVPGRRALALQLGATHALDPADGDPVEQVKALTGGRGVDVALEAAGPEQAVQQAVMMSRRAGTVVLTGVQQFQAEVSLPQLALAIQGRKIIGCQNGQSVLGRDIPRCVELMESERYLAAPIVTAEYALSEVNEAMYASGELRDLSGVFTSFR